MNTKKISRILCMVVIIVTSFSVFADSEHPQNSSSSGNGSALLDLQVQSPKTKRVPYRNYIELVYSNGMLFLESNYNEGEFSVLLQNVENCEEYYVPKIEIGESLSYDLSIGEYHVRAVDSMNRVFDGIIDIVSD